MNNFPPEFDINKIIAENSSDIIYIVDFNETFTFITPSAKKILGYDSSDVVGKKIYNFLTPKSYERQKIHLQKVLMEKRFDDSEKLILSVFKKDGTKVWMEANAQFIKDKNGRPVAILGIARDVTDRIRYEENLLKKISSLES